MFGIDVVVFLSVVWRLVVLLKWFVVLKVVVVLMMWCRGLGSFFGSVFGGLLWIVFLRVVWLVGV